MYVFSVCASLNKIFIWLVSKKRAPDQSAPSITMNNNP